MKNLYCVLLLISFSLIASEEDVSPYKTNYQDMEDYGNGSMPFEALACEKYAITPYQVDPNGSWSGVCEGFSGSMRLRTNTFNSMEPILIYLFLRNCTNHSLPYNLKIRMGNHSSIARFDIKNSKNISPIQRPYANIMPKYLGRVLGTNEQERFLIRLDKIFILEPDEYKVRAIIDVPTLNKHGTSTIITDWLKLHVISNTNKSGSIIKSETNSN